METEVKVDTEHLRKQYLSMSDEALLEIDPDDLTWTRAVVLMPNSTAAG